MPKVIQCKMETVYILEQWLEFYDFSIKILIISFFFLSIITLIKWCGTKDTSKLNFNRNENFNCYLILIFLTRIHILNVMWFILYHESYKQ